MLTLGENFNCHYFSLETPDWLDHELLLSHLTKGSSHCSLSSAIPDVLSKLGKQPYGRR